MRRLVLSIAVIFILAGNAQWSEGQENGGLRLVNVQPIAELPGISDVDHALLSPDASTLAWINDAAAICIYQFADETQRCIEQEDGRLTNLYWSPDSTHLAAHETLVFRYDLDVWMIDLEDETLTDLTDDNVVDADEEAALWDETFAWDGDSLIFVRYERDEEIVSLQRINADGSGLTQIADISTMHEERFHIRDIALSPDGAQLALISFENRPESNQLWIVDLASGEFTRLARQEDITTHGAPDWYIDSGITGGDMLMWVEWTADGSALIVGTDNPLYITKSLINTFKVDVETTTVEPFLDWTAVEDDRAIYYSTSIYGYTPLLDRQLQSIWLANVNALVYFSSDGDYSGFSAQRPGNEPVRLILEERGTMQAVYDPYTPNSVGYGNDFARVAIKGYLLTFEKTDTEGITSSLQ